MTATVPKYRLFIANNFWSLFGAGFVLFWDVLGGNFALSALVCPIWFLVTIIRNRRSRTEWRLALFRAAMPALTLGIAVANESSRCTIAEINGKQIVRACESFYADNGRYPQMLNELVPQYLPSIPHAVNGEFRYHNPDDLEGPAPILVWDRFMFQHHIYDFGRKEWHTLD